jgi:hypothetical protein
LRHSSVTPTGSLSSTWRRQACMRLPRVVDIEIAG